MNDYVDAEAIVKPFNVRRCSLCRLRPKINSTCKRFTGSVIGWVIGTVGVVSKHFVCGVDIESRWGRGEAFRGAGATDIAECAVRDVFTALALSEASSSSGTTDRDEVLSKRSR
jgi:hypothetical protein